MKDFQLFTPEKYAGPNYEKIVEGIYKTESPSDLWPEELYVTSLTFVMEPDRYGEEGGSPRNITQVPFEDILDNFFVFVTDFYPELNEASESICYQEFGSYDIKDVRKLHNLIGKRFYAVPYEQDGEEYYDTVIE